MPSFGGARHAIPVSISGKGIVGVKSRSSSAGQPFSRSTSLKSISSNFSMDFGTYLLSTSPPVNFAFSYAEPGYDSGGNKVDGCDGTKSKLYNIPTNEQQLLINRCSDLNDIKGFHEGRLRDTSPSFTTRTFGHILADNTYLNASRSGHKVKPCLRTWSLYESNYSGDLCRAEDVENVEDYADIYLRKTRVQSKNSKKVTFADDIGRRLVIVRIFEEPPDVPTLVDPPQSQHYSVRDETQSGFSQSTCNLSKSTTCPELILAEPSEISSRASTSLEPGAASEQKETSSRRCLVVPNFPMPAASYASFRRKIEVDYVSLESVHQVESTGNIRGTIKVKEIAFEKSVFVRATFDGWETSSDFQAEYVAPTDAASFGRVLPFATFSFLMSLPYDTRTLARRGIQFAVCYKAAEREYWDNNSGSNYEFNCPDWATSGVVASATCRRGSVEPRDRRNTSNEAVYNACDKEGWGSFSAWSEVDATVPYW